MGMARPPVADPRAGQCSLAVVRKAQSSSHRPIAMDKGISGSLDTNGARYLAMAVLPAGSLKPGMVALRSAALSSSDRLAVTYGGDVTGSRLTIWDVPSLGQIVEAQIDQSAVAARFTSDETAVLATLRTPEDGSGRVVRCDLLGHIETLYDMRDVAGIAMSRDARTVVFRNKTSGMRALDTTSGNVATFAEGTRYSKVVVSPSGTLIAGLTRDRVDAFARDLSMLYSASLAEPVVSADCADDTVVTAGVNSLWVFSGKTWREIADAAGEKIRRIALNSRGDTVAVAYGNRIRLVDLMAHSVLETLPLYSPAQRLTFSLDDAFLITAHEDNVARLWNLAATEPATVAQLLDSGHAAEQAGDADQAAVWYQRAIETSEMTGLLDLARITDRAGHHDQASELTERWASELLGRLSASSQAAIAYAEGLRLALGQDMVNMNHLLLGLSEKDDGPFQRLLSKAGIARERLPEVMGMAVGASWSFSLVSASLRTLPPMSEHVTQALDRAAEAAAQAGSSLIRSRYLLYGALSVTESPSVKVLASNGVSLVGIDELELVLSQPGLAGPRPVLLAGAAADTVPKPGEQRVRKADRLAVAGDVEMLVSVLLARNTPLPLAVGLFGDWGSGKSFFMAFMEERIAELSKLARQGKPEASPYCREVRQIRFNAWHYVDANLWASMAATLFDQLATADAPTKTQVKLTQLGQAREEARKAEHDRQKIEHDVAKLAAETDRFSTIIKVSTAVAIRAVRKDPRLHAELRKYAREEETSAETTQLVSALGQIDTAAGTAKVTWRLFEEEVLHRRSRMTLITLLVLIGAGVVASAAVSLPIGAKILTFAGAVAAALSPALAGTLRVLYLAREARETRELPLVQRLNDLAQAQATEQEAQWAVAQRERELAELRDKGLLLQEFVRGRAASLDYRGKLGVISQVRYDFEELVGLLPDELGADQFAAVSDTVSTLVPEVERIILFIDDLDRCPPNKVVEVLQAVHLLLAFPLFVVVVGVDSRWLERSLRAHYRNLLEEPDSYLEKIFQIPFMLRPMTLTQHEDLVDMLLAPPPESGGRPAGRTPLATDNRSDNGRPEVSANPDALDAPETTGETEQVQGQAGGTSAVVTVAPSSSAGRRTAADVVPPPLPRPQALEVSSEERELLGMAGVIVPTPRAVKRLVNIYRMLRVSVPADEVQAFMPEGEGEYQVVVLLVAILVGRPAEACQIFAKLTANSDDDDIWNLLTGSGLHEKLAGLREHVTVTRAAAYRRWAPRVARFSFRFPAVLSPDHEGAPGKAAHDDEASSQRGGAKTLRPTGHRQQDSSIMQKAGGGRAGIVGDIGGNEEAWSGCAGAPGEGGACRDPASAG
jgi:KAP family P-loop domain/Clp amino terminal domain, pathogenicity island component